MLVACWSAKGGVGTSVVAVALALLHAERSPHGAVLADLAGDAPTILGIDELDSPGLAGWLSAGTDVPADALGRIEVDAGQGVAVLPRGEGPLDAERAGVLASLLGSGPRPVVVDCGASLGPAVLAVLARADTSLLVTRACYVALRRARRAPVTPTGVVLVHEDGRALTRSDVEDVAAAPVVAAVPVDPRVASAVDAGVLASRLPRSLARALSDAV